LFALAEAFISSPHDGWASDASFSSSFSTDFVGRSCDDPNEAWKSVCVFGSCLSSKHDHRWNGDHLISANRHSIISWREHDNRFSCRFAVRIEKTLNRDAVKDVNADEQRKPVEIMSLT
jgi:hypothetical protein